MIEMLKKYIKKVFSVFISFLILSILFSLLFLYGPIDLKNNFEIVLIESFAVTTMILIFVINIFFIGGFLLLLGSINDQSSIYKKKIFSLIEPLIWFLSDLVAPMFGVVSGMVLISFFLTDWETLVSLLFLIIKLFTFVLFNFSLIWLSYADNLSYIDKKFHNRQRELTNGRLIGLILIIISLVLYFKVLPIKEKYF